MGTYSDGFAEATFEPTTLVDVLRWRALHQPNQLAYTFLVDGETEEISLTYGELDRQVRAIAAKLQALAAPGARALLLYPPGLELIAACLGCLYSGIIAVPFYPPLPARLSHTLPKVMTLARAVKPLVVLTTALMQALIEVLFAQEVDLRALRWLATDQDAEELAEVWREPVVSGSTLAFLQATSGSTTTPRGVMLSHSNIMHNLALIYRYCENSPHPSGVIWLPPYHDMGLIGGVLQPLYGGFPVTLMSPVAFLQRPIRWLQTISRLKATVSSGPNFAYDLCLRKIAPEQRDTLDLSSWVVAFNGAEPIRPETLERFAAYFEPCGFRREAFYPCYGLAEATLIVSGGLKAAPPIVQHFQASALAQNAVVVSALPSQDTCTLVGCGQALAGQKIVIVDPQSLTRCRPDHIGEIWVSGSSIAQGYWNQPDETVRTFQAYLADTGEGPFLRTADLGFLKDGELFVTGRLKDLIIIDGSNHYPHDIERTVEQSHQALRPNACAAFAVDVAGREQLVVVAEVERRYRQRRRQQEHGLAPGVNLETQAPLDTEEVVKAIRRAVAEHHDLRTYDVLLLKFGSIPKTSSGKIQRYACRAGYLAGTLDVLEHVKKWDAGCQLRYYRSMELR